MRHHPLTAEAWRHGELSTGQVDVIEQIVKQYACGLFAEHEAAVVPALAPLSVPETVMAMNEWAHKAEAILDRPAPDDDDDRGSLFCSRLPDGTGALNGTLDVEGRELFETALRLATTRDSEDEPKRTWGQKRLDALKVVCKHFLDNQTSRDGGSHRPHISVITTLEDLTNGGGGGRYADGTLVDPVSLSTYLCDCNIHRVLLDQPNARIDIGSATKTISADLRSVLIIRDHGCRFPSCDRPATWCDAHHVQWWTRQGPTNQDNLVLLCRKHHQTLHKRGWHAKVEPDGTLTIHYPDGRTTTTRPPAFKRE